MSDSDPNLPFKKMNQRDDLLRRLFDGLCAVFRPHIICDVGAFNGDESYRLASLFPDIQVIAFEASPRNYRQFFVENDRFNALPNFKVEHTAIADVVGQISFNVLDAENEASDWRRAANSLRARVDGLNSTTVSVPCTTLDQYFKNDLKDKTFALWIDVEGALERVINGSKDVLDRTLLIRTEIEWKELWEGGKLSHEIKRIFDERGFTIVGDSHLPKAYDQSDILLINKNVVDLLSEREP